jgi:hypothetical protein
VTDVEKADDEPGADAIRGALSIRRFSTRRTVRPNTADSQASDSVNLPAWKNRRDGAHSPDWRRESTIREVPAEEEEKRKSSMQFDPNAPHTHIYPPRSSPESFSATDVDHVEEVDFSKRVVASHNTSSPAPIPEFISTLPTPRYNVGKRGTLQKQFSFGKTGRKNLTEEETIGLVEAGRNEGGMSDDNDDKNSGSHHSENSEDSDYEGRDVSKSGRGTRKEYMF